jgi:acylphosphatase
MDVLKADIKTFRILISGRVQGVGFRYFAHDRAVQFNIKGYVQNTHDNKVEIICQGKKNDLDIYIMSIKKGPALSFISEFILEEISDFSLYDFFNIKH